MDDLLEHVYYEAASSTASAYKALNDSLCHFKNFARDGHSLVDLLATFTVIKYLDDFIRHLPVRLSYKEKHRNSL